MRPENLIAEGMVSINKSGNHILNTNGISKLGCFITGLIIGVGGMTILSYFL